MTTQPSGALPDVLAGAVTTHETAVQTVVLDGKTRLMLTVKETAELLNISERRVLEAIASGELPALDLYPGSGVKRHRLSVAAVVAFSRQVTPPAA